jgi:hypothetical protein
MAEVVEFFLKMDPGLDDQSTKPPFILHFGLPRNTVDSARRLAETALKSIRAQRPFANDSHAAQFTLANSVITGNLHHPDVKQVLHLLLVHLCTDGAEKRDTLAKAKMMGYLIAPSPQALAHAPETDMNSYMAADKTLSGLMEQGISPFRFRFAALMG